jgi:hypothetical protein
MGLITHKNSSNQRTGATRIPFTTTSSRSNTPKVRPADELKKRSEHFKNYLHSIAKNYCQSQGYGYVTFETSGAPGSQFDRTYNAIGYDGDRRLTLPFTDSMHRKAVVAHKWAETGQGERPEIQGASKFENDQPLPAIAQLAMSRRLSR